LALVRLLMIVSLTSTVPAAVPSLFQSPGALDRSDVPKKRVPFRLARYCGPDESVPGTMSATSEAEALEANKQRSSSDSTCNVERRLFLVDPGRPRIRRFVRGANSDRHKSKATFPARRDRTPRLRNMVHVSFRKPLRYNETAIAPGAQKVRP